MKSAADSLETETFTAEREWVVDGIPVLTARIALPEPVGPETRLKRRIRRYYRTQCRAYLRYCGRQLFPMAAAAYRAALASSAPLPCFHAELTYHVTCQEGGFWSLYTQSQEPDSGGRTLLRRWGDTWDLRTGYPAALPSFFPLHSGWKRKLLHLAAGEIRQQEAAGYAQYLPAAAPPAFQPTEFLPDAGGTGFLLPHVRHCPGDGGHPLVYRSMELSASRNRTAVKPKRRPSGRRSAWRKIFSPR